MAKKNSRRKSSDTPRSSKKRNTLSLPTDLTELDRAEVERELNAYIESLPSPTRALRESIRAATKPRDELKAAVDELRARIAEPAAIAKRAMEQQVRYALDTVPAAVRSDRNHDKEVREPGAELGRVERFVRERSEANEDGRVEAEPLDEQERPGTKSSDRVRRIERKKTKSPPDGWKVVGEGRKPDLDRHLERKHPVVFERFQNEMAGAANAEERRKIRDRQRLEIKRSGIANRYHGRWFAP